jgi:beta-aspartyl-dipeptidase (metallo-type)
MFKLFKNAECYTPMYAGRCDVFTAAGKIAVVAPEFQPGNLPGLEVFECAGKVVCPGFVDQHVHISGGGGEDGPASSIDPIALEELTSAGVTTVVGVLGVDTVGKSMQGLLMKARSLEEEGISSYIYAGHYGVPPATITGNVMTDIAIIDKVIGTGEIAISDHRSSYPTCGELSKLAYEALTGGLVGKKAGVMHLHVGNGKKGLGPLLELLENSDFPASMFVPTHLNRSRALFKQALQYRINGGIIDLTAGEEGNDGCSVPYCLKQLIKEGNSLDHVTISSDGNGSGAGKSGKETARVMSLFCDIRTSVLTDGLPLEEVLKTVTSNVAGVLKLLPAKGQLAPGSDADILIIDREKFKLEMLFARGQLLYRSQS